MAFVESLEVRRLLAAAVLRVDSGSKTPFTDSAGDVWAADRGYSGGNLATSAFDVANTSDDPLYYISRYGKNFSYSLAVPNGKYNLTLLFAETYAPSSGKFDLAVKGKLILDDVDLSAKFGKKVAIQTSAQVDIVDGKLDLKFTGVVGNATISAIQLAAVVEEPPPAPPSPPPPPPPPPPEEPPPTDPPPVEEPPPSPPPPPPPVAPNAPSSLSLSVLSSSQIKILWKDNSTNETGFKIERKSTGGEFAEIALVAKNATSFTNSGLVYSTSYTYRVRATFEADSDPTNEISAKTSSAKVTFKTVAASPVKRAESPGATVNGKLYVFGGYQSTSNGIVALSRCDRYDPASNKWTQLADMPTLMTHCGIAVDGNVIWLVGGYLGDHPGPGVTTVLKYDTATETWSNGPDLPEARGAGAAAIVGRELHFFGGMNETRDVEQAEHWALNLDDEAGGWTEKAPMLNRRNHLAGASVGGMIYAIGGQHDQEDAEVPQSQVDRYDPATDTWTQVASLPVARSHIQASTFVREGRIVIVGGGYFHDQPQKTVYSYDPGTDAWINIGTLPQARETVVAGWLGGNQFISSTGNGPDATTTTWIGTIG